MKRLISLIGIWAICMQLQAQFEVQYVHANPFKFSLSDFNNVSIQLLSDKAKVNVKYTLIDKKTNKICEISFNSIELHRGSNRLLYQTGEMTWSNSPYRDLLMKNQLVTGSFHVCVAVTDLLEVIPNVSDCFEVELSSEDIENPLGVKPIELQSPYHKDTIDEIRPFLTWIPPSPVYQGTMYYLILTEKKDNQTCVESLNNNVPIIDKKGLLSNQLNYPTESPALLKSHRYCWRVSAYTNEKEYTRSEDWEFAVRGEENAKKSIPFVEDVNGLTITVRENLAFAIKNYTNEKSILIKMNNKLKEIPIEYGVNVVQLPIEEFNENQLTLVEVYNINNSKLYFYVLKK